MMGSPFSEARRCRHWRAWLDRWSTRLHRTPRTQQKRPHLWVPQPSPADTFQSLSSLLPHPFLRTTSPSPSPPALCSSLLFCSLSAPLLPPLSSPPPPPLMLCMPLFPLLLLPPLLMISVLSAPHRRVSLCLLLLCSTGNFPSCSHWKTQSPWFICITACWIL